jgi:homocysteine S-methyltransferase
MKINILKNKLNTKELLLMDGAIGTEISRHGFATHWPLWSAEVLLTNPQIVSKIHKEYIKAGAEIIITNTFRTTERSLMKKNIYGRAAELTAIACNAAKKAILAEKPKRPIFIAGSIAPLEDCYSPELTPSDEKLEKEHLENARNLKKGGVDFLLLETMITSREIHYAVKAAQKLKMPFALSFCCDKKSRLLSGEDLQDVIKQVEKYKPLFVGVNCVTRSIVGEVVKRLNSLTSLPIAAYAQGDGDFYKNGEWIFNKKEDVTPYISSAKNWIRDGATIIGGCCGTTPYLIQELKRSLIKS